MYVKRILGDGGSSGGGGDGTGAGCGGIDY